MQRVLADMEDAVVVRELSNGLTVTLEPLPHLRSAAAGVWLGTGSVNETGRQSGISHLLEHLFFKGTATRTARDIVEAVERTGGQLNAFTTRDHTCVYVKTLDEHLSTGIEILADVMLNSRFVELEKERKVVLEEITSIRDVPEEYVHELVAGKLWPGHPLGRSVAGDYETVSQLGLDDIVEYYRKWCRARNICFSVAGGFDLEAVFDQISSLFGELEPGPAHERPEPPEFGSGHEYIYRDIGQSHVCIAFPGATVTHPDRYACDILTNALGGGSTSRLFDNIREKAGLAYNIYGFNASYDISGMSGIYAAVAPGNLERVLDMIAGELHTIAREPMSHDELDCNREQLKGNLLMALENTFVRMLRLAKSMMYYHRLVTVQEVVDAVDAVTVEHVQDLADKTFRPENVATVVLGPSRNGGTMTKRLER